MELIIEVFCEEIPARMQRQSKIDFLQLFKDEFDTLKIQHQGSEALVGPRRLALHVSDISESSQDLIEERRGPKIGAPEAALQGFLKSTCLSLDQLNQENGYWFAKVAQSGQKLVDLLPGIIDRGLRKMPWPTSMRWPGAEHTWVRPIRNICCVLDGKPVTFAVPAAGVTTNNQTFGHRFLTDAIIVTSYSQYVQSLKAAMVIPDFEERRSLIDNGLRSLCESKQLSYKPDDTLLDEVTGLVEQPFIGLGNIDAKFMHLPDSVLSTSMRVHQKYFTILNKDGSFAPFFGYVANVPINLEYMQKGYESVLRARLSDASFFYEEDLSQSFSERISGLKNIIFHADLGSVYQKVERLNFCANDPKVKQAALLCKNDLLTNMVGEFPELQGIMGEIYAKAQGVDSAVAAALKGYYQPQGANDACPLDDVSWELSLLDKVDSLVGFFGIGMKPSGSKDPYGLRRSALGIIGLMLHKNAPNNLLPYLQKSVESYANQGITLKNNVIETVVSFITERLSAFLKTEMPADHVYAVLDNPLEDVWLTVERARTLKDLLQTEVGTALLGAYRRIVGILEKSQIGAVDEKLLIANEERNLYDSLAQSSPKINQHLTNFAFKDAMTIIASLKPFIDNFFDNVKVMDDDLQIRQNRLNLLGNLQATLNSFANFLKLEG